MHNGGPGLAPLTRPCIFITFHHVLPAYGNCFCTRLVQRARPYHACISFGMHIWNIQHLCMDALGALALNGLDTSPERYSIRPCTALRMPGTRTRKMLTNGRSVHVCNFSYIHTNSNACVERPCKLPKSCFAQIVRLLTYVARVKLPVPFQLMPIYKRWNVQIPKLIMF